LKSGLSSKIILAKINASACQFDTSPLALQTLKQAGATEEVIVAMVQALVDPASNPKLTTGTSQMGEEEINLSNTNDSLVKTRFDRFKQITVMNVDASSAGPVSLGSGESARVLVHSIESGGGFTCPGEATRCVPTKVEILFIASTSDWQFSGNRRVRFLVDGSPVDGGQASWDGSVNGAENLTEYIDVNVLPDLLRKIGGAKNVEVQLGVFQFSLTTRNLEGLKALASHVKRN
jgi:hypothetical protein